MPDQAVRADDREIQGIPRRHGRRVDGWPPCHREQCRKRRHRRGGEPPRDEVHAGQVRKEQQEHRHAEPEEVPSRQPQHAGVHEREPAGVELGEVTVRELAGEHALRALGERAVVEWDPPVIQLRRDEDRARKETHGRNRPRRRARQLPGTGPQPRPRWAVRDDVSLMLSGRAHRAPRRAPHAPGCRALRQRSERRLMLVPDSTTGPLDAATRQATGSPGERPPWSALPRPPTAARGAPHAEASATIRPFTAVRPRTTTT